MTERLLCLLLGYAFGNILTAEIVCRVKAGVSASAIGTGNPGMANVMANLGFAPGIVVLGGDLLKTIAACLIAGVIGKNIGSIAVFYAGAGSVIGHDFPIWRKFRGGKGVSSTCIAIVLFLPIWGLISCAAAMIVTLWSKSLPLGGVMITTVFLVPAFLFGGTEAGVIALLLEALMIRCHFPGLRDFFRGQGKRVDVLAAIRKRFGKTKAR